MVAVEARLSSLYAGQGTHTLALMRIADTQAEHTTRLDGLDKRLDGIEQALSAILAKLA
jgi:hypothetical protein